jgi:hypothetical protein
MIRADDDPGPALGRMRAVRKGPGNNVRQRITLEHRPRRSARDTLSLRERLRNTAWVAILRASVVPENRTAMAVIEPPRNQKGRMDVERETSI